MCADERRSAYRACCCLKHAYGVLYCVKGGYFLINTHLVWSLEAPSFQTLVVNPEPAESPLQDFNFVTLSIAKDKQARRKGIQFEGLLHQGRESVDGLAHVRRSGGEVDFMHGREVV